MRLVRSGQDRRGEYVPEMMMMMMIVSRPMVELYENILCHRLSKYNIVKAQCILRPVHSAHWSAPVWGWDISLA